MRQQLQRCRVVFPYLFGNLSQLAELVRLTNSVAHQPALRSIVLAFPIHRLKWKSWSHPGDQTDETDWYQNTSPTSNRSSTFVTGCTKRNSSA